MEQQGYIHSMEDVKVLILYTLARLAYPVDVQRLYELCYQDDRLSYFDLREALPQMLESGHIAQDEGESYTITDKGREAAAVLSEDLAVPVARRVQKVVERFNDRAKRDALVHAEAQTEGDCCRARLKLDSETGRIMELSLLAPNAPQARRLAAALHSRAEEIYQMVMGVLVDEMERKRKKE